MKLRITHRQAQQLFPRVVGMPGISETEFTAQILELAEHCGWRRAHFRPARTAHGWRTPVQGDGKGFPDLVLSRGGRIIFAELKVGNNGVSPEQRAWLRDLALCDGVECYVWRPKDWPEIQRILR